MHEGEKQISKKAAALEVQKHLRQKIQISIFAIVFMLIGAVLLRWNMIIGSVGVGVGSIILAYFILRDRSEAQRLEYLYNLPKTITPPKLENDETTEKE